MEINERKWTWGECVWTRANNADWNNWFSMLRGTDMTNFQKLHYKERWNVMVIVWKDRISPENIISRSGQARHCCPCYALRTTRADRQPWQRRSAGLYPKCITYVTVLLRDEREYKCRLLLPEVALIFVSMKYVLRLMTRGNVMHDLDLTRLFLRIEGNARPCGRIGKIDETDLGTKRSIVLSA